MDMKLGFYPGWDKGLVLDYLNEMKADGQRKKTAAKLQADLLKLEACWPHVQMMNITVKHMVSYEPLRELVRPFDGIAYRIFFCVKGQEIWTLRAIEKKKDKTPEGDARLAYSRMQDVFSGRIGREK